MPEKLYQLLKSISERIKDELLLFSLGVILLLTFIPREEARYIILAIYLIGSVGYITFRVKSFPKVVVPVIRPKIHADTTTKRDRPLLEIVNTGNEDIVDFHAKIKWNQKIGGQERDLQKFLGENDDAVMTYPKDVKVLKRGERIYATGIPLYSTDGKITIFISGTGAESNEQLSYSKDVKNEVKADA